MEAVLLLHGALIVHRDLRWDNVVYNRANDRFILIDFDDSVKLDDTLTTPAIHETQLSREQHAPACFDGPHGRKVDVWSLGFLMIKLAEVLDDVQVKDKLNHLAGQIQKEYKVLEVEQVHQMCAESFPAGTF
jgi:serine/threonine protein kinase